MSTVPADGTVLHGDGAYAYVMAGGQRRAIPDTTTLRVLGHALDGALSQNPAAMACIPMHRPVRVAMHATALVAAEQP